MKQQKIQEETKQTNWEVDVRNIHPLERAGGNIREDYGDIDELAKSIEESGIMVPIRAYRDKDNDGQWIAIDGHRRLKAAMWLVDNKGLTIRAKVIVVDYRKLSDEQLVYDMVITNSGKELNPVELAEAVRRLIAYGHKPKEISAKFGKPLPFVKNLELFSTAPKRIKELVKNNKVSYSLVLQLLRECPDYNAAILKIEAALKVAKENRAIKSGIDVSEIDEEIDLGEKITKRSLDKATNRIDSFKELQRAIDDIGENVTPVMENKSEFYNMLIDICKNRISKREIINYLIN